MKLNVPEITVHNADKLIAQISKSVASGDTTLDFEGVKTLDSSALAVVLAARRAAGGKPLQLQNLPAQFQSLAAAYGVQSLFA